MEVARSVKTDVFKE